MVQRWLEYAGRFMMREEANMARPPAIERDTPLTLHANHLSQRMRDFNQVGLRGHHRVDRLVRRRCLIDHVAILPALHAFSHTNMILNRESASCLVPRHCASRTMTATVETFRIALSTNDV